jgi:nicotinate phosphoribosyltransferase
MPTAKPEFFTWLLTLDCSKITMSGIRDGHLVFSKEPLLRFEGPLAII